MTGDIFQDRWHWCALAAGFLAAAEGRLEDSAYVRELAYRFYEEGAFADRVGPPQRAGEPGPSTQAVGDVHTVALAEEVGITAQRYHNNRKG